MSLGFYGGRPLIPQGMVPVMVPGSNASLLGSPPGQVRPLLGQQVQAMGVQPGAALPPGVMQPGQNKVMLNIYSAHLIGNIAERQ